MYLKKCPSPLSCCSSFSVTLDAFAHTLNSRSAPHQKLMHCATMIVPYAFPPCTFNQTTRSIWLEFMSVLLLCVLWCLLLGGIIRIKKDGSTKAPPKKDAAMSWLDAAISKSSKISQIGLRTPQVLSILSQMDRNIKLPTDFLFCFESLPPPTGTSTNLSFVFRCPT